MKVKTLTIGSVVQFKKDGAWLEGTVFCFHVNKQNKEVGILCNKKLYFVSESVVILRYVYVSNKLLDTSLRVIR